MNAIILAAGQGTRLKPLTNDKPKCLVPLFGKSILEWQLDLLNSFKIKNISNYFLNIIDHLYLYIGLLYIIPVVLI